MWATAAALRTDRGIHIRVIAANTVGAVLVAVESMLVGVPASYDGDNFGRDNLVSTIVMVGYLIVAIVAASVASRRLVGRTFGWVDERRQPAHDEVEAVIDYSWVQAKSIFAWWAGGAVVFTALNFAFGNGIAWSLRVGFGVVLGGLTSAAVSFLLLERFNRPAFALAFAGEPVEGHRLGLHRRLLFTWALGAAVPVLVIVVAPAGVSATERADLAGPLVIVGVIALAAGLVLTVVASRSISEPIEALRDAQRRVGNG